MTANYAKKLFECFMIEKKFERMNRFGLHEFKRRKFVVLELNAIERKDEITLLSEPALAVAWNHPEEGEARPICSQNVNLLLLYPQYS